MSWQNVHYDYGGAEVLVTGGTSGIGAGIAAAYREASERRAPYGSKPALEARRAIPRARRHRTFLAFPPTRWA